MTGANHLDAPKDDSQPLLHLRCEQVHRLLALRARLRRAAGHARRSPSRARGFDSKVAASQNVSFMDSECVSCGACVQACPTATLSENTLIAKGQAEHSVTTTCAYCGVGCSFRAEMQGEEVVRMVPNQDGHANHGPLLRQGALCHRLCDASATAS